MTTLQLELSMELKGFTPQFNQYDDGEFLIINDEAVLAGHDVLQSTNPLITISLSDGTLMLINLEDTSIWGSTLYGNANIELDDCNLLSGATVTGFKLGVVPVEPANNLDYFNITVANLKLDYERGDVN